MSEIKERILQTNERNKVDMSPAAVTARLKRAGGLSDSERLATMMRDAIAEMFTGKTNPGMYPKWRSGEKT